MLRRWHTSRPVRRTLSGYVAMRLQTVGLKRWVVLAFKVAVVGLVVWFVQRTILEAASQIGRHPWAIQWPWLAAAGGLYGLGLLPPAGFWYAALRSLGQQPRCADTLRAYYVGHLGKYVPGKAMVVVIRAGLIGGQRVDTAVAAASVFLETLTWIASGSFLAAAYLGLRFGQHKAALGTAVGLMVLTGLPTFPPVFTRLARWAGVGRWDPLTLVKLQRLGYRTILLGWVLMPMGWAMMGLAYWATLRAIGVGPSSPLEQLPRCTAAVSLATVAGFAAIFIPAGLGVREVALVELMMPYFRRVSSQPELVAWAGALLLRLVCVVSELVISGILYGAYLVGARGFRTRTPPR